MTRTRNIEVKTCKTIHCISYKLAQCHNIYEVQPINLHFNTYQEYNTCIRLAV